MRASGFPGSAYLRRKPPQGFGVRFSVNDDHTIFAKFTFDPDKEGPPGYAHGGAVATILDETMGTACFEAGRMGFTATLTVNYKKSAPLGVELQASGRVTAIEGSKTFVSAEILLPDGQVCADATAIFIYSERLLSQIKHLYRVDEDEA